MAYATGSTGLAITVRGSSRRIMIMRFRPANIRLINRRSNLPRLLLALSSGKSKNNDNDKNNPIDSAGLTGSLHIRPTHSTNLRHSLNAKCRIGPEKRPRMRQCMVGESPLFPVKSRDWSNPPHPIHSKSDKKSAKQCVLFLPIPYTCLRIKTMSETLRTAILARWRSARYLRATSHKPPPLID